MLNKFFWSSLILIFILLTSFTLLASHQSGELTNRKLVGRPEFFKHQKVQISPDSRFLVFTAIKDEGGRPGLYSKPLTGGTAVQLNNTLGAEWSIEEYTISPDSKWVVYLVEEGVDNRNQLYSVPIIGPEAANVKLNGPSNLEDDFIEEYEVSPDSKWVFLRSDLEKYSVIELFRVPIEGGLTIKISGSIVSGGDVDDFAISPDGSWIVYRADQDSYGHLELYSVPLMGGPDQVRKLNHKIRDW